MGFREVFCTAGIAVSAFIADGMANTYIVEHSRDVAMQETWNPSAVNSLNINYANGNYSSVLIYAGDIENRIKEEVKKECEIKFGIEAGISILGITGLAMTLRRRTSRRN